MKKILLCLMLAQSAAYSQETKQNIRCNPNAPTVECGWHYGFIDQLNKKAEEKPAEEEKKIEIVISEEAKEKDCQKSSDWSEECGFIDPGTDYDFMAKQRDVLLKNLLMKSGDLKAVENMQRFQKWMIDKAIEASNVWEYNLVQKPELSASFKNPVTTIGLRLANRLDDNQTESITSEIASENGFLVWFTRSDCVYCKQQLMQMVSLKSQLKLDIRNVSLDEQCYTLIDKNCISAPESIEPAKVLEVNAVPSIYLYLDDKTWIKISNGMETNDIITRRLKNFFLAIKNSQLNASEQSVDFSNIDDMKFKGGMETK